jgi:hypothetical protein
VNTKIAARAEVVTDELPPLPLAVQWMTERCGKAAFSIDQMRDYGQACARAVRMACADRAAVAVARQ